MSKVGICRISSIFIIMIFTLTALGYSQYFFSSRKQSVNYPTNISYTMLFIIPILLLVLYTLLLFSYVLCIVIKPRKVPEQYNLSTAEIANFMIQPDNQRDFQRLAALTRDYIRVRNDIQVWERDYRHGGLRICEMCSIIKPDRSHHCNICGRCVLRMDHHCLWVNNCIHEGNHKFFMQSISLGIMISLVTILHHVINIWFGCKDTDTSSPCHHVCVLLYVSSAISGIIFMFLLFLTLDHCSNLFRGQTSYERMYDRDNYSRGWRKNFMDIMGHNICQWICPVPSTKLSAEQEPLIRTVAEQSSQPWVTTSAHQPVLLPTPMEDDEMINSVLSSTRRDASPSAIPSRQNSGPSSRSEPEPSPPRDRTGTISDMEETLSLAYQTGGGGETRVRTPSVFS